MNTSQVPRIPRYLKLAEKLRRDVHVGKLKPGDRLPSFAAMKAEYGLSQNTWDKAHTLLEQERVIVRLPNRGTFVAEPPARPGVGVIGVAMGVAPWQHPYYAQLLKGIHRAAHEAGIEVLLLSQDAAIEWEKVDGVLAVGKANAMPGQLVPGMPCVSVLQELEGKDSIVADDAQGMCEATEHLVSLGHRRIAFLGTGELDFRSKNPNARLMAYHDALQTAGITPNPRWVRSLRGKRGPVKSFVDLGRERMRQWLRTDWKSLGCTALLAQNDESALSVIEVLHEAGIEVPRQVSVVGFDGTEIAQYFRPRLTTVKVPLDEIGAAGVTRLMDQINQPLSPASNRPAAALVGVVPTNLLIGESTSIAITGGKA